MKKIKDSYLRRRLLFNVSTRIVLGPRCARGRGGRPPVLLALIDEKSGQIIGVLRLSMPRPSPLRSTVRLVVRVRAHVKRCSITPNASRHACRLVGGAWQQLLHNSTRRASTQRADGRLLLRVRP